MIKINSHLNRYIQDFLQLKAYITRLFDDLSHLIYCISVGKIPIFIIHVVCILIFRFYVRQLIMLFRIHMPSVVSILHINIGNNYNKADRDKLINIPSLYHNKWYCFGSTQELNLAKSLTRYGLF